MAKPELKTAALPDKLSFSYETLAEATDTNRTTLFGEAKAGRLKVRKLGRRTVILRADAEAWLQSLPIRAA